MFDLDQIPILEPGGEPPGRWAHVESEVYRTWTGQVWWKTLHGGAVAIWHLGSLWAVEGATLEDCTPLPTVRRASAVDHEFFRRPHPDGVGYQHGTVRLTESGAVFRDGATPRFVLPPVPAVGEAPDLFAELARDREFMAEIQSDGVAVACYEFLKNRDLRKSGSDRRWSCSWRRGARFVAEARDKGETYTDFYPYGGECSEADAAVVEGIVARLGWKDLTQAEMEADHGKAVALVEEIDARPTGECPEWAKLFVRSEGESHLARAINAAIDGKVTEAEWRLFGELYEAALDEVAEAEKQRRLEKHLARRMAELGAPPAGEGRSNAGGMLTGP